MSPARPLQRVLVTGSAGFIGSAFVHRLMARHAHVQVVSLDALTYAGDLHNLAGLPADRHTFVHGDICDRPLTTRVLREHSIDTVVNFAAESHVDRSIEGSAEFMRTNVDGTHALLEAARQAWLIDRTVDPATTRFHQISTDEVYGDLPADASPSVEGDRYEPSSPYAASKAAADHLVRAWHRTYGLSVTLSHGSNTYGPHQYPEKLLPVVVGKALAGESIPVYGDGQQVRDWLHVDDHADGVQQILERGEPGRSYNLGGDNERVNLDLVHALCRELDTLVPEGAPHNRHITFVTDRLGHDRRYALDTRRARTELGWHCKVSWESGLSSTVAQLVAHATSR